MINTIDILEDGKLSAFTGAVETYLQPEIIVDTLDSLQQLLIKDQFGNYVKADTTISSIKGVPFAGTFADLETSIRDLALESNGLFNGGTGGGGGGGDASAANQLTQITELQKLTAANLPSQEELINPSAVVISAFKKLSFVCTGAISVTLNGNTIVYPYNLGGAANVYGATFEADDITTNAATFNRADLSGVEQITGPIITPPTLTGNVDDYNPTGFSTCNLIRQEIDANNREISGFLAPAVGVNRIIYITNISGAGDDLKFMHNNAGSLPANRILLRDNGDRTIRPNETAAFYYDHLQSRFISFNRIG